MQRTNGSRSGITNNYGASYLPLVSQSATALIGSLCSSVQFSLDLLRASYFGARKANARFPFWRTATLSSLLPLPLTPRPAPIRSSGSADLRCLALLGPWFIPGLHSTASVYLAFRLMVPSRRCPARSSSVRWRAR